jgi:hypothetical protein
MDKDLETLLYININQVGRMKKEIRVMLLWK